MASNLHSSLAEAQLHNPKGFSTASNNTHLTKNSSGNLSWASNRTTSLISTGGYHTSSSGNTGEYFGKAFSADYHNYSSLVDPLDATNGAVNWGMKWAHMSSEFVCPRAGTIASWKIIHGGTANADYDFELYKYSVTDGIGADVDLTLLGAKCDCTNNGSGSKFVNIVDMVVTGTLTVAANDIIICLIRKQTAGNKSIWWNGTLEIIWDI